jgi:hypothetical protein
MEKLVIHPISKSYENTNELMAKTKVDRLAGKPAVRKYTYYVCRHVRSLKEVCTALQLYLANT